MTKKNKQKSVIKKQNLDDDKILDYYIQQNSITTPTPTPTSTPIIDSSKKQLKQKLKNAILQKNTTRFPIYKKQCAEKTEELNQMLKHPKMNKNILELYAKAIASNFKSDIPTPIQIFDNKDHYLKIYYQYIIGLLNIIKEKQLSLSSLDKLLDTPYCHYLSKCLECPLNPFNK